MKTKNQIIVIVSALIMAMGAVPAASQDKPADNMQIVREKIRADKKLFGALLDEGIPDSQPGEAAKISIGGP